MYSNYPVFFGLSIFTFICGLLILIKFGFFYTLFFAVFYSAFLGYLWLKDVILEDMRGQYSFYDYRVFRQGFRLFLFRELILFFTVFWLFFDYSLCPVIWLGGDIVPTGILSVSYLGLNALATSFLIINSQLVKYCRRLLSNNNSDCLLVIIICIFVGVGFVCFQLFEYSNLYYSICDSTFGRTFFLGTGLHGRHVFVGVWFLIFCYIRIVLTHFNWLHIQIIDLCIDYWRFLEWIWGFIFSFLYVWGS